MQSRFIPDNSTVREYPAAKLVGYEYNSNGAPALVIYHGRKSKPLCHVRFSAGPAGIASREKFLTGKVSEYVEREQAATARRTATHTFKLGDVLMSTWGYEQTNVDFYQVIAVPSSRSVTLRELCVDVQPHGEAAMSGRATPRFGEFKPGSAASTRRATGPDSVSSGTERSWRGDVSRWNGLPVTVSSYA